MECEKSNFLKTLSKKETDSIPLYCTGFPENEFIEKYTNLYDIRPETNSSLILRI